MMHSLHRQADEAGNMNAIRLTVQCFLSNGFLWWTSELWSLMTCWGKWNATWHFIFTLFCWCLSAVETLIEQLHEAWDVQSCLFALKLVVQRKELSRLLGLRSAHFYVTAQSLTWEPELIVPLKSMLMLGLYQHISEPSQKRLSKAFIQWSVIIGVFSVLGALSKCSRRGPPRWMLRSILG